MIPVKKKSFLIACLCVTVFISVEAFTSPQKKDEPFKNLQVLPKDISSKDLSHIMVDDFSDGLGMSCKNCHAKEKDSEKLDYASDAKPEKQIARAMMQMTLKINKDFFNIEQPAIGTSVLAVSCETCHKGQPHPDEVTE